MMTSLFLLLAQAQAQHPENLPTDVGSGVVEGGWGFVTAGYVLTIGSLALYALSLYLRRPQQLPPAEVK
jgi:hypothetical protein